jgi:TonB family protein
VAKNIQPAIQPAPSLPSLNEGTPFTKPEQDTRTPETRETPKIEETLKRNIPNIQTPPSKSRVPNVSRGRPTTQPEARSSTPKLSAPLMAKIPESPRPQPSVPARPKMSETVQKLMEGLKSTTQKIVPQHVPQIPSESSTKVKPPISPPPSAIDQRIAKLSIPEVSPVESIKQRLQLLEVQTAGSPGGSTSKPSPGKNRYLAMVEDRIDRHWVAPPLLASNPVVVLNFHISRSGDISNIHITESSGHAHYDSSAQRAVQAVNPLPPFPPDISDSFFDVTYRFIKD